MKNKMTLDELIDYFDTNSDNSIIIKHSTRMVILNSLFRIKNQVTGALEYKDELERYLKEI